MVGWRGGAMTAAAHTTIINSSSSSWLLKEREKYLLLVHRYGPVHWGLWESIGTSERVSLPFPLVLAHRRRLLLFRTCEMVESRSFLTRHEKRFSFPFSLFLKSMAIRREWSHELNPEATISEPTPSGRILIALHCIALHWIIKCDGKTTTTAAVVGYLQQILIVIMLWWCSR